jgi:hypothetical protein
MVALLVHVCMATLTGDGDVSGAHASRSDGARAAFPGPHQINIIARDGTALHTVWTLPGKEDKKYPAVIDRSPYGDTGTGLSVSLALALFFFFPPCCDPTALHSQL